MTNQKAFKKRKQITVEIVIERREVYDNNENDNINNNIKGEHREGVKMGRR